MTLPKWIEEEPTVLQAMKLKQALEIAWEAHESISKNGCCDKCQEAKLVSLSAMRRIDEMGEGK